MVPDQSRINRRQLLLTGAAAAVGVAGWSACKKDSAEGAAGSDGPAPLIVGGLPVTCNLTLPIACSAKNLAMQRKSSSGRSFDYQKFNGWPEIKESLMS